MTLSPLERVLTLSIRILKTTLNCQVSLEQKGVRIQNLNSARADLLSEIEDIASNPADNARIALIRYIDKLSKKKIREQL